MGEGPQTPRGRFRANCRPKSSKGIRTDVGGRLEGPHGTALTAPNMSVTVHVRVSATNSHNHPLHARATTPVACAGSEDIDSCIHIHIRVYICT
jgi:hypothetical protein